MPSRNTSRAASNARNEILESLKDDHRRVKKAYREFTKLDREDDTERCEALVQQVLADLKVHTTLEEELLYPAARDAISEPDLVDEAEVEHESARALIGQLESMEADDEKFAARFTVLCEYVMHHVKEEEGELFPQLERARLDWETLAREFSERRAELTPSAESDEAEEASEAGEEEGGSRRQAGGDGARASGRGISGAQGRGGSGTGMTPAPGDGITNRRV